MAAEVTCAPQAGELAPHNRRRQTFLQNPIRSANRKKLRMAASVRPWEIGASPDPASISAEAFQVERAGLLGLCPSRCPNGPYRAGRRSGSLNKVGGGTHWRLP